MLYDGTCALCSGVVRFVAANDPGGRFAFASLASSAAHAVAGEVTSGDSIVLLDYGRRFERSDAVLYLTLGLRAPWALAFAAILIPRPLRDAAYDWIARNRYRWFGRSDACAVPTLALRARLIDGG